MSTQAEERWARLEASTAYHERFESAKWRVLIPYIQFPADWEVKIIPPENGAVIRFHVRKGDAAVSVYLDGYNILGLYGPRDQDTPYWEVYPVDGDIARCGMDETEELLRFISQTID